MIRQNVAEWGRPPMTTWRMRTACWITKDSYTIYCFPTGTKVARTRLKVRLYVYCLSRFLINILNTPLRWRSAVFVWRTTATGDKGFCSTCRCWRHKSLQYKSSFNFSYCLNYIFQCWFCYNTIITIFSAITFSFYSLQQKQHSKVKVKVTL
jgi:hypothetical protein